MDSKYRQTVYCTLINVIQRDFPSNFLLGQMQSMARENIDDASYRMSASGPAALAGAEGLSKGLRLL
jgi:hypothetical protein